MPKIRGQAVELTKKGWGFRKIGRHLGFHHTAVMRWVNKSKNLYGYGAIPTLSSKPKHHPKELKKNLVDKIVKVRLEIKRCAEVVHRTLENEGVTVSLSSVKRTLDRSYLTKKKSPWKRLHFTTPRPSAEKPGDLVQLDTIHIMIGEKKRIYVYTLLDVYSRWAYAITVPRIGAGLSVRFLQEAQLHAPFKFNHLQSDNGPEFSTFFSLNAGVAHRHSRIRKPNDNAHLERFNRTIQEECLDRLPKDLKTMNAEIRKYLEHYNNKRLHLGINYKTPIQMVPSY